MECQRNTDPAVNKDEGNMPSGECSRLSGLEERGTAIQIKDQIILNG